MQDVEVVADLKATANFLANLPDVRADCMGIIGHCMGGRTAFIGAAAIEQLKAAVILYGGHLFKTEGKGSLPPIEHVKDIKVPILGLYGDKDHVIPLDEIKRLIATLDRAGVANEFHIYKNAGHAFQDFSRPDHYRKEACEDAWVRTLAFFSEKLSTQL
jgi:carboxymethylenebutenolidase